MDQLHKQVARARRRLIVEQYLARSVSCLLVAMTLAAAAIAAPRVFVIASLPADWDLYWLLGALGAGFLGGLVWTLLLPRTALDAAVEIDRRFELRERVASCLSLSQDDRASDAGRALVGDASRMIARIDVDEKFRIRLGRRAWWPLVPAGVSLFLVFLDIRVAESSLEPNSAVARKNDQKNIEALREKIAAQNKKAGEKDLPIADEAFKQIDEALRDLNESPDTDRTQRVVKLNDLAQQLEERRQQLGAKDELQKQLDNMKNLGAGPAEKAAQAMKEGNWEQAKQELEKLQKQLMEGKLDDQAKQDLAKQIQQMKDKLEAAANARQQAMDDLRQQIEQQKQQGNMAKAGELQQKLDQLQQQQKQMDRMQQMAQKMAQAQQALQQGDGQQAAEAMQQMAEMMAQMAQEQKEMEALDAMLNDLQMAKDMMACQQCAGAGCQACQAMGMGQNAFGNPGMGMGEGKGVGPRPEEKNATNLRDTRVRQNVGRGGAVFGGMVEGPNIKGQVTEVIREELAKIGDEPADPLTAERLPPSRREHAEEYFRNFRGGK